MKVRELKTGTIAAIIIEDEKLLLVKGKGYEYIWTPGGKLETEETDVECLKRELKEEIGVDLVEAKFFKEYPGFSFFNQVLIFFDSQKFRKDFLLLLLFCHALKYQILVLLP